MQVDGAGAFRPSDAVTTREVHRALVLAIGMGDLAAGADALHLRDGTPIATPKDFGTLLIGMRIGLRYNHRDESLDVGPDDPLPRAEVAWSLFRAATAPPWIRDSLSGYATMTLPNLTEEDAGGRRLRGRIRRLPVRLGWRVVPGGTDRATAAGPSRSAGSTAPA